MEEGFGVDKDSGAVQPSRWIKGPPESSWWQGADVSNHECRLIVMMRCATCGFLELYANQQVSAPSLFKR